jgi:hypothetical protein
MRLLLAGLLLIFGPTSEALALLGATEDSADRFPFVVELKFHEELICSGTVLFPRIVVTAAHCVQNRGYWRAGRYVADYLKPTDLTVSVTHDGKTDTHRVIDVAASPVWQTLAESGSAAGEQFAHDIALIITSDPMDVGLPPSLDKLARDELVGTHPGLSPVAARTEAEKEQTLKSALSKRLTRHGLLVAFGAEKCWSRADCGEAGIRRFQPVSLKESADCFNDSRGKPRWPPLPAELAAQLPLAIWCMESSVMPGDSGGALLVEGTQGQFYYLGVISAQQGPAVEVAATAVRRRSLATALYPSLDFIAGQARKLGYMP